MSEISSEVINIKSTSLNPQKSVGTSLVICSCMFSFSHLFLDWPFERSLIIHLGAIDHMTNSSKYFHTYVPCPRSRKTVAAERSLDTIAGTGNIKFSPTLVLENVLPFSLFTVTFKIRTWGRQLGMLKPEMDHTTWTHLSYLSLPLLQTLSRSFDSTAKDFDTQLFQCWRLCLLFYLKTQLIKIDTVMYVKFAKYKCVTFLNDNKRSMFPFSLIHNQLDYGRVSEIWAIGLGGAF